MAYGLLELIKSKNRKRNNDFVEYQSLPESVKKVSYRRDMLFFKFWFIEFEGKFDLRKIENICEQKNYSLINAAEDKDEKSKAMKEHFRRLMIFTNDMLKESDSNGFSEEMLSLGLDIFTPDIAYNVYKGKKKIAYISWMERDMTLTFGTSKKKGLELAEAYRTSLLHQ